MTDVSRDELLLRSILDRSDGDILNIVQAAAELPGDMYDRLSKAYYEITRGPLTPAEENEEIGLKDVPVLLIPAIPNEGLPETSFEPGKRYRVTHQSPTQHYARVSVMDYLGTAGIIDELSFSARPIAGTQKMPRSWIIKAEEVDKGVPISLNMRARD